MEEYTMGLHPALTCQMWPRSGWGGGTGSLTDENLGKIAVFGSFHWLHTTSPLLFLPFPFLILFPSPLSLSFPSLSVSIFLSPSPTLFLTSLPSLPFFFLLFFSSFLSYSFQSHLFPFFPSPISFFVVAWRSGRVVGLDQRS